MRAGLWWRRAGLRGLSLSLRGVAYVVVALAEGWHGHRACAWTSTPFQSLFCAVAVAHVADLCAVSVLLLVPTGAQLDRRAAAQKSSNLQPHGGRREPVRPGR